jgi:hypothetical protein
MAGKRRTAPVPVSQSIDAYVESIHSRNGFSRDRMTPEAAAGFDAEARRLLGRFVADELLHFEVVGSVIWGRPG